VRLVRMMNHRKDCSAEVKEKCFCSIAEVEERS